MIVVMFLLPMVKVRIPSFERKMAVKELLNVVKFLVQTIWLECFQLSKSLEVAVAFRLL